MGGDGIPQNFDEADVHNIAVRFGWDDDIHWQPASPKVANGKAYAKATILVIEDGVPAPAPK